MRAEVSFVSIVDMHTSVWHEDPPAWQSRHRLHGKLGREANRGLLLAMRHCMQTPTGLIMLLLCCWRQLNGRSSPGKHEAQKDC